MTWKQRYICTCSVKDKAEGRVRMGKGIAYLPFSVAGGLCDLALSAAASHLATYPGKVIRKFAPRRRSVLAKLSAVY